MKLSKLLMLPVLTLFLFACGDDNNIDLPNPTTPDSALITEEVPGTVATAYARIKGNVEADAGLNVIAEVNHTTNAAGVGLDLRPTQLIIFGSPEVGTQLMQVDQRIGIDLPLKALVWEDEDNDTQVSFYNASTLTDRYDINGMDELVDNVNSKLATITTTNERDEELAVGGLEGDMTMVQSTMSATETYAKIKSAIEEKGLNIMAEINHAKAASNVGMMLRPTQLIIFGNPEVGTQFMQKNQMMGVDLPMKMLVWEDADGMTWIGYYQATELVDVYDIDDLDDLAEMVNGILSGIITDAMSS